MGRRTLKRFRETLHKGINEQAELVQSGECADARNVWAPNGRVVSRPGYESLWPLVFRNTDAGGLSGVNLIYEDNSGASPAYTVDTGAAFTFTLAVGDRFYFATTTDLSGVSAVLIDATTASTTDAYGTMEYWNGTRWVPLPHVHGAAIGRQTVPAPEDAEVFGWDPIPLFATLTDSNFVFTPPADWAITSVSTVSDKYMFRITCLGEATSATTLDPTSCTAHPANSNTLTAPYFVGVSQFDEENRVLVVTPRRTLLGPDTILNCAEYSGIGKAPARNAIISAALLRVPTRTEGSLVNIPQTGKAVLLTQGVWGEIRTWDWATRAPALTLVILSTVEDSELIVGDKAAYSRDYISQRYSMPDAELVAFARNRLFCSLGENVYWSAPLPYTGVWPLLNYAPLLDGDSGAVTEIRSFGEQVVVFKNNSVYTLSYAGETGFATARYSVSRVVVGVGCVARGSVQEIRGRMVFLADSGIFVFDGTPHVQKVTENKKGADRLAAFIPRITDSARSKATSVHWRAKSCYLLSVPIDGSEENNATIVWDYKADTFWIWDNFKVFKWLEGASFGEPDLLYFMDYNSTLNRLGIGRTDHFAAVESYITSHRIGYRSGKRLRIREVEVTCSNRTRSVTAEVWPNERENNTVSGTIDLTDSNETDWDDTITDTTTNWVPYSRRTARMGYRVDCDYAQIKISHSTANQPFELSLMDVGFMALGDR